MITPQDKIEVSEQNLQPISSISIGKLIKDTGTLKALLLKETQLLKEMQFGGVRDLMESKGKLVRKFEIIKELLDKNPELMEQYSVGDKEALKMAASGIEEILRENFRELLKAKEVNREIVRIISNAATQYDQQAGGYNEGGTTESRFSKTNTEALTINQTI